MKKVSIICQYAENKGDRAIAEFVISKIKRMGNISITLSTTTPSLWKQYTNDIEIVGTGYRRIFPRFKNRILNKISEKLDSLFYKFIVYPELLNENSRKRICNVISKNFINLLKSSDIVIVTGGHHITSIRNKNALFPITYDIALASIYSRRYVLWSQTIGPLTLQSPRAKELFANILTKADRLYIRDENSATLLRSFLGSKNQKNVLQTYDTVFGYGELEFPSFDTRENKVGISIFDGLKNAFDTYPKIAKLLDYFASQHIKIEFFRMEHGEHELNNINKIINLMSVKTKVKVFPFSTSTVEHLAELSSCKYFIGYKTHSVIMALTSATPLIGICYHKKTMDFLNMFKLGKFAIDDKSFNLTEAISMADSLIKNGKQIHLQMRDCAKKISSSVTTDLNNLMHEYEK